MASFTQMCRDKISFDLEVFGKNIFNMLRYDSRGLDADEIAEYVLNQFEATAESVEELEKVMR